MIPDHVNPVLWQQSIGLARQASARIFRDGGTPADALRAFGLDPEDRTLDWSKAVETIAESLAATAPRRRAA